MILDKLLKARHMTKTVNATKRLLSERGESNAASMASDVIENYNTLDDEQKAQYFHYLTVYMQTVRVTNISCLYLNGPWTVCIQADKTACTYTGTAQFFYVVGLSNNQRTSSRLIWN